MNIVVYFIWKNKQPECRDGYIFLVGKKAPLLEGPRGTRSPGNSAPAGQNPWRRAFGLNAYRRAVEGGLLDDAVQIIPLKFPESGVCSWVRLNIRVQIAR